MQEELIKNNPILRLSFDFALHIIEYTERLQELKKYTLATQLFRSGTSIGANTMEAQNAESKADFIHKMKIAAKEADETEYWLRLCDYAPSYPDCKFLLQKVQEINRILGKILSSSKRQN